MGVVRVLSTLVALLVLTPAMAPLAQDASGQQTFAVVSRDRRDALPLTRADGRTDMVGLDAVARVFGVTVQEDTLAGAVTVTARGQTIVATAGRQIVSVGGRVVSLPQPVVRADGRWLVPLEFLSGPLATILGQRVEVRRASNLIVLGDLRLPRVTARVDAVGPPTRVTIDITPQATVTVTREPGQLVLTVEADALDATLPGASAGLIDAIRLGEAANVLVVATPDTAGAARATITTAGRATRVLIDVPVADAAARPPAAAPLPVPTPEPTPTAAAGTPPPPPPVLLADETARWRTIVIDPGHGGPDTGVLGRGGLAEKDVVLDVARLLRGLIESRLGLRVILTRDGDLPLSLDQRAAMANNSRASLLLSVHANGTTAGGQAGAEILHLGLAREDRGALRAASAAAVSLPALGGRTRQLELVPWDLAQSRHVERSAILARVLREELARQVPMGGRPVRQGPMRLLSSANMPAAIVEMAYLSSPTQEARLQTDEFKSAIAQALFTAIARFRTWAEDQPAP